MSSLRFRKQLKHTGLRKISKHGHTGLLKMSGTLLTSWNSPHPPDCPAFDYEDHSDWQTVLPPRVASALMALADGQMDSRNTVLNSRPLHHQFFSGLTPASCEYFAGHYRGEEYRCLKHYTVTVSGDPRVGAPPHVVWYWIEQLNAEVKSGLDALDADFRLSREERLRYLIGFACRVFELFLRIHPFANGNGHVARFIVWCILGRYGHWPRRWPVEPRPPDPPYSDCIVRYRNGDRAPLEHFIAATLVP
jgi:Fic/DOC family